MRIENRGGSSQIKRVSSATAPSTSPLLASAHARLKRARSCCAEVLSASRKRSMASGNWPSRSCFNPALFAACEAGGGSSRGSTQPTTSFVAVLLSAFGAAARGTVLATGRPEGARVGSGRGREAEPAGLQASVSDASAAHHWRTSKMAMRRQMHAHSRQVGGEVRKRGGWRRCENGIASIACSVEASRQLLASRRGTGVRAGRWLRVLDEGDRQRAGAPRPLRKLAASVAR